MYHSVDAKLDDRRSDGAEQDWDSGAMAPASAAAAGFFLNAIVRVADSSSSSPKWGLAESRDRDIGPGFLPLAFCLRDVE